MAENQHLSFYITGMCIRGIDLEYRDRCLSRLFPVMGSSWENRKSVGSYFHCAPTSLMRSLLPFMRSGAAL